MNKINFTSDWILWKLVRNLSILRVLKLLNYVYMESVLELENPNKNQEDQKIRIWLID